MAFGCDNQALISKPFGHFGFTEFFEILRGRIARAQIMSAIKRCLSPRYASVKESVPRPGDEIYFKILSVQALLMLKFRCKFARFSYAIDSAVILI